MTNKYQPNYAAGRPQMYNESSRQQRAIRIVKTLEDYFGKNKLKKLTVLDIGSSTGIIDNVLSTYFKKVTGTDIDHEAILFAKKKFKRKNLLFKMKDAMRLTFKSNSFDIVICTHVYEHVPSPKKLFDETYRVLKPNGVCYLAAQNKLWPIEAHNNLLFLSYLPKNIADLYVKIFRGKEEYYEHPLTYWQLRKILDKFLIREYTSTIFLNPKKFGYKLPYLVRILAPFGKYFAPTLFWLLEKK